MPLCMTLPTALLLLLSWHADARTVEPGTFDEEPAISVKDGFSEESATQELFGMSRRRGTTGGFGGGFSSPRRRAPSYGGGFSSPRRRASTYGGGSYGGGYGGGNHVEYRHKSAGSVFMESLSAAVMGFVLFVLGFPCLWFNEQRQAKMEDLFLRAAKIARTDVSPNKVDPSYERMLVHMKGYSKTEKELSDPEYQLTVTNCAHLTRTTEMLQWVEQEHTEERDDNFGGKETITTYSYNMEWRSEEISSSGFRESGHINPSPCTPLGVKSWNASPVTFGAFTLPERMVNRLRKEENCTRDTFPGVGGTPAAAMPASGGQQLPPGLDSHVATGFLSALESEYVQGQEGAVGNYFDTLGDVSDQVGQQLESLEEQARSSANPQGFVLSLRQQWGLTAGGVAAAPQGPVLPGGWRRMGNYLETGTGNNVGDMRVTFTKVPCGETTLFAVQAGDSFEPMDFKSQVAESGQVMPLSGLQQPLNPGGLANEQNIGINIEQGGGPGCCSLCCGACGLVGGLIESEETVYEIHESHMSATEVMDSAMSSQKMLHLGLRLGGWLLICIGLTLMFNPFPTLFRFIPFLGTYVQTVVGWVTTMLAFLLGSFLACVTIALAWLAAHPAKSIKFLIMGAVFVALMYMLASMYSQASSGPV